MANNTHVNMVMSMQFVSCGTEAAYFIQSPVDNFIVSERDDAAKGIVG